MTLDRARAEAGIRAALPLRGEDGLGDVLVFAGRDLETHGDIRQLAYMLATTHHETAHTWRAIEEYGRGEGHDYGQEVTISRGNTVAYYGRGFVQLTWLANYMRASMALGIDLVTEPSRALEPGIAWQILERGMRLGWFGRKLGDYVIGEKADYVNARRCVNGTDRAKLIAGYAVQIEAVIREAVS